MLSVHSNQTFNPSFLISINLNTFTITGMTTEIEKISVGERGWLIKFWCNFHRAAVIWYLAWQVMQSVKKITKFCLLFKKVSVSWSGEKQTRHLLQWRFFKEICYYNTPNCIFHIVGLFAMDRDNISLTWRPPQADFPLFTTKYSCIFSVFFLFFTSLPCAFWKSTWLKPHNSFWMALQLSTNPLSLHKVRNLETPACWHATILLWKPAHSHNCDSIQI